MKIVIQTLCTIVITIGFVISVLGNNNMDSVVINNVEFPSIVEIGDVALFKCHITNTGSQPISISFNLNLSISEEGDEYDFSDIDEMETFENVTIEPGDSLPVERPIYINNARMAQGADNVILTWPSAVEGGGRGNPTARTFYVADEDLERDAAPYDECNIEVRSENNQVIIDGLSTEFETSIIDQDGIVKYFCNGNCLSDEIVVDLPDFGFFLIQIRSLIDQQCISFNSVVVGDWNLYQLDYNLDEIFYIPPSANFDFESALLQEINELQAQIDAFNAQILDGVNHMFQAQFNYLQLQNELAIANLESKKNYLHSLIEGLNATNTEQDCNYTELSVTPQVNNIAESTALVSTSNLYIGVSLEIKESTSNEWIAISVTANGAALLSQLKGCTKYDIRNAYSCDNGKIESDIVTFETEGCENLCDGEVTQLYKLASFGSGVVLNWDVLPGKSYRLQYKATNQVEWKTYNTNRSIALFFDLNACSTYEFKVNVICEANFLSNVSNTIAVETGNCRLGSDLLEEDALSVYPTIATNYIGIVANDVENIIDVNIYDLSGNLVKTVNPQIMSTSVSDLPSGAYIVTAIKKDAVLTARFIKQ